MTLSRRTFLAYALIVAASTMTLSAHVDAKDGGGSGGGSSGGRGSGGSGSGGSSGGSGSGGSAGGSDGSGSGGSGHSDGGGSSGGNSGSGNDGGGDDHSAGDGPGHDNGDHGRNAGRDFDRARDAVRSGQALPLKSVLQRIDANHYGRVIDVDLNRSGRRDVYRLKLRDDSGTVRTLRVDARTGAILGGD